MGLVGGGVIVVVVVLKEGDLVVFCVSLKVPAACAQCIFDIKVNKSFQSAFFSPACLKRFSQ